MGDIVVHSSCFQCDNCGGIDFKSNEKIYTDRENLDIFSLCKSCTEEYEPEETEEIE